MVKEFPESLRADMLEDCGPKDYLTIMDATAFSLCMDNEMPILVFNMQERGSILRAVQGERIGTLVH